MEPLTRRGVLVLAATGAVVVVGGGAVLWSELQGSQAGPTPTPTRPPEASTPTEPPAASTSAGTLREPGVLTSSGGLLELTLTAAMTEVTVADARVRALTYNGTLPGPTLRVRPGDRIALTLRNELAVTTNLHTHGLVVSPEGNADNVFVMIEPGATFEYEYQLGLDHPPGVFWYHPHHHGNVADQLFGGLYGAIIVEDDRAPDVARERLLVISDIGFDSAGAVRTASPMERMLGREGDIVLVNGQVGRTLTAQPGDRERWRIVNACSSRYLRVRVDGQMLQLLGIDSGQYAEPLDVQEVELMPGNRADLLVTAAEGTSVLRTLPFDRGGMGGRGMGGAERPGSATTGADLATFVVSGSSVSGTAPMAAPAPQRDLRLETVTGRRTLTLAMGGAGGMGGMGGMAFTIDGRQFDEGRVDVEVGHDTVEEWTLVNTSTMDHPFHLHVWPMQLIEVGGTTVATTDYRDVVPVPTQSSTVVRIAFSGLTGTTVYHCHILDHEDLGMMGVIRTA
jgi:FtsP/CotA-like multicopper oxidase with cupredoxin domain